MMMFDKFLRAPALLLAVVLFASPAIAEENAQDLTRPWFNKSNQYLDEGKINAAIDVLQEILRIDPGSEDAHLGLSLIYLIQRQPTAALSVVAEVEITGSAQATGSVYRGFAYRDLDRDDEAQNAYRLAVEHDSAKAVQEFLNCLRRTTNLEGGKRDTKSETREVSRLLEHIECFKRAVDFERGDIPLPSELCRAQFADGRYERMVALRDLSKLENSLLSNSNWDANLTRLHDFSGSESLARALMQIELHLYEEAIVTLDRPLPGQSPASDHSLFRRTYQAVVLSELGRHDRAIRILREVVRLNHTFSWGQYYLGRSLEADGQYMGAVRAYEIALLENPDIDDIAFRLGNCYSENSQHEMAMSAYLQAILEEAESPEVYNNLGSLLFERGIGREAIENFRKAIEINPRYVDAWYNLGRGYEAVGKPNDAKTAYERVLSLDRHHPDTLNNIGVLLAGMGRSDESVAYFRQALICDPDFGDAHFNLGCSLKSVGRYAEAVEHFEYLTERGSEDVRTWRELGICQEKRGLLEEAMVALEKTTELDYNDFNAWYFLARTYRALGRKDDAARAFRRMKVLNPALAEALD
ncbi:MAG: tetratricopeptide repeat protein [bacterium]|nr:tetratricopeptide repeat protein [bacterium]